MPLLINPTFMGRQVVSIVLTLRRSSHGAVPLVKGATLNILPSEPKKYFIKHSNGTSPTYK
jgi:hypothetical protein